jgi:hypothetical protein
VVRRDPEALHWVGSSILKTNDTMIRRFIRSYILKNFEEQKFMQCVPMSFRKDETLIRQCIRSIPVEQAVERCKLLNAMPKAIRTSPAMAGEVFGHGARGEKRGYMAAPGVMVLYSEPDQLLYGTVAGSSSHSLQ